MDEALRRNTAAHDQANQTARREENERGVCGAVFGLLNARTLGAPEPTSGTGPSRKSAGTRRLRSVRSSQVNNSRKCPNRCFSRVSSSEDVGRRRFTESELCDRITKLKKVETMLHVSFSPPQNNKKRTAVTYSNASVSVLLKRSGRNKGEWRDKGEL